MDTATELHTFEEAPLPMDRGDFADTQEHGQATTEETIKPVKQENVEDIEWPDFSNDDPDEFFSCDDFEEDFSIDAVADDFNPDTVLSAGWASDEHGKQPAWRELERRREQMELERALHDELFDF